VCFWAGSIVNGRHSCCDFGESGKNFIEIGKRANVQETMLSLRYP
jgi:hypothetical protein